MINPFIEIKWNPDLVERRKFARSLVFGFPCVAVLMLLMGRLTTGGWNFRFSLWLAAVGVGAGLVFLALPRIVRPFYLAWYLLASCIGIVVSNVLLGAVFFVIVTGIGLIMRLLGRRSFSKSFDRSAPTYWKEAVQKENAESYYRQF
jgi:hypothetical protein